MHVFSSVLCFSTSKRFSNLVMSSSKDFSGYRIPDTRKALAYEIASTSSIRMPVIILVNPFLDANVGSVSRAMLNFGLSELRIVDPCCDILSEQAQALAAGSIDILKNAKVYPTVKDCIVDLQRVIATTARTRDMTQAVLSPQGAASIAINPANNVSVGILFGRERNGLTNEELALADSYVAIPAFSPFSSLNLAQAVNIISYELWKRRLEIEEEAPPDAWLQTKEGDRLARREELENLFLRMEEQLLVKEYQPDPSRREICFRNIRSIYQRAQMTRQEVDSLHGVLSSLIRPIGKDQEEANTRNNDDS